MASIRAPDRASPLFRYAALAAAAAIVAGFGRTYYLRPWLPARPISALVHLHGLLLSAWLLLFATQAWLIGGGRIDWHRRLGRIGAALALAIVAVGSLVVLAAIERRFPGTSLRRTVALFIAFDGLSLFLFGALVLVAIARRVRPDIHKRLMLAATATLLPPAVGRIAARLVPLSAHDYATATVTALFVIACAAIDTAINRRLHPAMLWGAGSVVAVNAIALSVQTLL